MTKHTVSIRVLHRVSAMLLAAFLILHVSNHLAGVLGREAHIAFMAHIRPIYRNAFVEPLILALLVWQMGTGATMALRGWRSRTGFVAWLQAGSGIYMALFLIVHVSAVMAGRYGRGLDTNFNFAAAGFHVPSWPWFFGPYYFFAIAALFSHAGSALYWLWN